MGCCPSKPKDERTAKLDTYLDREEAINVCFNF